MEITLIKSGSALSLPSDLIWSDEFTWAAVSQSKERGLTGAWLIDVAVRNGGQPITLTGEGNSAWIERSALLTLNAWARIPGQRFTLELRGQTYTVIFDHGTEEETKAMAMSAVVDYSDPEETDYYCSLTLRFIEASEIL